MTHSAKPTVVLTGVSGGLGLRTLKLLIGDFNPIGVDIVPPPTESPVRFENIDLGREFACRQLVQSLRQSHARAVVHLAFTNQYHPQNAAEADRMWQTNVTGTARVMEAITEINRTGGKIDTFIFVGSSLVYGSETYGPVKEEHPLGAHTFSIAVHNQEADDVVRFRAATLGQCSTYVLRPALFAGAGARNYLLDFLRGAPSTDSKRGQRMNTQGKRLAMLLPNGRCLENRVQFVHVDDVARLIAYLLQKHAANGSLTVLNVAGRGEPITLEQAAHLAGSAVRTLPGRSAMRVALDFRWNWKISNVPPAAFPYLVGSFTVNTSRLKQLLGKDYDQVIRYSSAEALQQSFRNESEALATSAVPRA